MTGQGSGSDLDLQVRQLGGCQIVRLAGEVDLSNAGKLQYLLCAEAEHGHVVVDLSHVELLDAVALSALLAARKRAAVLGTSLRLAGGHGDLVRMLQSSGLDAALDHHSDISDAVEAALGERDAATRHRVYSGTGDQRRPSVYRGRPPDDVRP